MSEIPIKESVLIDSGYQSKNYEPICFKGLKMRRWVSELGSEYKFDLRFSGNKCEGGIKSFMKMIGLALECHIFWVFNEISKKYSDLNIGLKCKETEQITEFINDQISDIMKNCKYWQVFDRPSLQLPSLQTAVNKGYDMSLPKRGKKFLKAWQK